MSDQLELISPPVAPFAEGEVREVVCRIENLSAFVRVEFSQGRYAVQYGGEFHRPDHLGMGTPFYTLAENSVEAGLERILRVGLDEVAHWLERNRESAFEGFSKWASNITPADLKRRESE